MTTLRALEARYQEWRKGRLARMACAGVSLDTPTDTTNAPADAAPTAYRPLFETPEDEITSHEDGFDFDPDSNVPYVNLALGQY